ncbi:type VI secretion system-associated protein TagF [candidate division KSB1 bacterium]|nr:type VI secretion system-associated protein TagF [candidate division KSB1 bacterium]
MSSMHISSFFFGKVPAFADFIRHNASKNEVFAFDQWLQQGIHSAKTQLNTQWNPVFDHSDGYHFHYYVNARQSIMGLWHPSRDSAGRRFPFVIAAIINRTDTTQDTGGLAPLLFTHFFQAAQELFQNAFQGMELTQIVSHIAHLDTRIPPDTNSVSTSYQNFLLKTTTESFIHDLWGSYHDSGKYLVLKNLLEILLPLRRQDASQLTLGLKFPLGRKVEFLNNYVSFWLDLTTQILAHPISTPYYFWRWPKPDEPAALFLFFRIPPAKNFIDLLRLDAGNDNICDLEREGQGDAARIIAALSNRHRTLLERPELTLQQFLTQIQ